jgi:alpha-L-rhamnosidase
MATEQGIQSAGELRGERLRCERLADPLAVSAAAPWLSWRAGAAERAAGDADAAGARGANGRSNGAGKGIASAALSPGQRPTAFRVRAAATRAALRAGDDELIWDSGRQEGDALAVQWGGRALAPGERVVWDVTVWDRDGRPGPPSAPARFAAGVDDWRGAQWVGHGHPWAEHHPPEGETLDPLHTYGISSALLRGAFRVERAVVRATAYATARGVYRLRLNGERVGDHELAPGWTDYRRRIHYQAFDVTDLVRPGENALGVELGEGWYAGFLGWMAKKAGGHYGVKPSALVMVVLEHDDGSVSSVVSDGTWQATRGPRIHSDLQMGERYDARLEQVGEWEPVVVHAPPQDAVLEPQPCEPVRVVRELEPVGLREPAPGRWVFDLGQNVVGWARLRVAGAAGTEVELRFAEALADDGTVYRDNLRTAQARDVYVLRGSTPDQPEEFAPAFTFHGFRYVEVTGLPGDAPPRREDLVAQVVHSDAPWAGSFACSNPLLNAIECNVAWSQRGNFLSVPTDCPQRDERLGWLADIQVFAATALRTMDCSAFLGKWLQDVRDAQAPDGAFPDVAPLPPDYVALSHGAPGWGDAGVLVPWEVWRASGDRDLLARAFPAMERWMDHLAALNPDDLRRNGRYNDYGDWLGVGTPTDKALLATVYWALDALVMAQAARALGRPAGEVAGWEELHARIAAAFRAEWCEGGDDGAGGLHGAGRLRSEVATQTACLLALRAELLPSHQRPALAAQLAADVVARGRKLSTGFIGTGLICPVLTEHGYGSLAYDLALADEFPSWGATIRNGATTMWERWDGWTPEGGFASPNMNSFNHYAFGAIGEWLHRCVAGLDQAPGSAGWRAVRIAPQLDERLRWARAEHDSPLGPVRAGWERFGDELVLDAELPPGTSGTVELPGGEAVAVAAGRHRLTVPWPAAELAEQADRVRRLEQMTHVPALAGAHDDQEGRDGDD